MLEKITTILAYLQNAMPRFQRYIKLFPSSARLGSIVHSIYDVYTAFLVDTAQYLKRNPMREWALFIPGTAAEEASAHIF